MKVGSRTPWGAADHVTERGPGIWEVSTPGHGGIKVDAKHNAKIPDYMRLAGGWYEEDIEAVKVIVVFPDRFREDIVRSSLSSLRSWFPDAYERFTGETIAEGESHVRDEAVFMERHRNDYIGISATDSAKGLPQGMVLVCATVGGRRDQEREEAYFLVPEDEYAGRPVYGFVVDLDRHKRAPRPS